MRRFSSPGKILLVLALLSIVAAFVSTADAAEVVLNQDFDAIANGTLPDGFQVIDGTWEVQDGKLVGISANSSVQARVVFGDPTWSNYEMSATLAFKAVDSVSRWTALMHRVQGEGGPPYSLFTLRKGTNAKNGLEIAYRTPASSWSVYYTGSWEKPFGINEPHRLRLVAYDSAVYCFVDGKLVLQATDVLKEAQGRLGLHVNGATVSYDDIAVKLLDAEDFAAIQAANSEMQAPQPISVQAKAPTATRRSIPRTPAIVAHRGASSVAPENTLAAFSKAVEMGADLIELDVQKSKDGQLIVIHDAAVNRTAKGAFSGNVSNLTLDQLKTLDAGSWKGEAFANEKLSTLEEVLTTFRGKARFLIELKAAGVEKQVAEAIEKTGMANSVVVQSFDAGYVSKFRELAPTVPAGVLFGNPNIADPIAKAQNMLEQVLQANATFAAVSYAAVTPEFVQYLKSRGISVFTWTVNSTAAMRSMVDAGVDGIITNNPDQLRSLLESDYDPEAWYVSIASPKPYVATVGSVPLIVHVSGPKGRSFSNMEIKLDGKPIYTGSEEPWAESIDSTALTDGSHELVGAVTTNDGRTFEAQTSFTVDNVWEVSDALQPPSPTGWFGPVDRSLTDSESDGWTYATENPEAFFGDADRKQRTANTDEYLIWKAANLTEFSITLYAKDAGIEPVVEVSTSEDGESWHVRPYTVSEEGPESSGWSKLVLQGESQDYGQTQWLKLAVKSGSLAPEDLQVGLVEFAGLN